MSWSWLAPSLGDAVGNLCRKVRSRMRVGKTLVEHGAFEAVRGRSDINQRLHLEDRGWQRTLASFSMPEAGRRHH